MKKPSKRFDPAVWLDKLVPLILGLLTVLMFGTFILIGLALAGLI